MYKKLAPVMATVLMFGSLFAMVPVAASNSGQVNSAEPCKTNGEYVYKVDVEPDDAVEAADIMDGSTKVGTLTANDPKGTVSVELDEGYAIDLCVFGGTDRQDHETISDGFVTPKLINPGDKTAGVSNFAWVITRKPVNGDEPTGEVTVLKDWDLGSGTEDRDDLDSLDANLEVRKTVDGDPITHSNISPGHTFTDLEMGALIEVIGEDVTGLPDSCSYTHDGFSGKAWTITESAPVGTITLTNTVTCEEVISEEQPREEVAVIEGQVLAAATTQVDVIEEGQVLAATTQVDAPAGAVAAGGDNSSTLLGLLASLGAVMAGLFSRRLIG